ncbi:MAG: RNA methyltransferase [Ignavibacteriales bacterium]|nr:RNA methyltransferase [Ignavibacteriales bacterium]
MSKSKLAEIKKLHQKKYREEMGLYIVEGRKSIDEALDAGVEIKSVVYDEKKVNDAAFLSRLRKSVKDLISAKPKEIESLSDAVTSQGLIAVLPIGTSSGALDKVLKRESALVVTLDGIKDPGNLGTIIRTCDWFGVDALLIGKNSVDLYNPKVVRATMGSMFHFPVFNEIDLVNISTQSHKEGFSIYSAELSGSDDVRKTEFSKKSLIVIGSESHGVSEEISRLADKKISIPKFGQAESLNAAMACGIILSHIKLR